MTETIANTMRGPLQFAPVSVDTSEPDGSKNVESTVEVTPHLNLEDAMNTGNHFSEVFQKENFVTD